MDYTQPGTLMLAYAVSNLVGLLILWAAWKNTRLARLMFLLLFGWACWINYKTSHMNPEAYLDYGEKAVGIYTDFIYGWFSKHITTFVTAIAIGQGLIAIGMALKGILVRLACVGAILFLLGIAPLGLYAAFPFSLIVSLAAYLILRKTELDFLWKRSILS